MGLHASVLGNGTPNGFSSKDVDKIWKKYSSKNKNQMTEGKAVSFLKELCKKIHV